MVVVVWLPAEWAWQAVLLVAGLASLSRGSDGKLHAEKHLGISIYLGCTIAAINKQLFEFQYANSHETYQTFHILIK